MIQVTIIVKEEDGNVFVAVKRNEKEPTRRENAAVGIVYDGIRSISSISDGSRTIESSNPLSAVDEMFDNNYIPVE